MSPDRRIRDLNWFEQRPLEVPTKNGVPILSRRTVDELVHDDDLDPLAAMLQAAATMDGLNEIPRKGGRRVAHGTQSNCDVLNEDEDAPPPELD